MKKLQLLILLGFLLFNQTGLWAQVFGHAGATWTFGRETSFGMCFEIKQKWTYTGDTTIAGDLAKKINVISKSRMLPAFPTYTTVTSNRFFKVKGDTVSILNMEGDWYEVYNFSLTTGDTIVSPLLASKMGFSNFCVPDDANDSALYYFPAVVTDHGLDTIDGESLRFYTVKYRTSTGMMDDFSDTIYAFQTYYERIISLDYWFPFDPYECGVTDVCEPPALICYKDDDMSTDSLCNDFTWFETLSTEDEPVQTSFNIYPNPASDFLYIGTTGTEIINYRILSIDGKYMGMYKLNMGAIDISGLTAGVYIITNETGSFYRKFIKK